MEIKEMFENIWKVKSMRPDIKEEDKKLYYDLFLDGYGCAILNIEKLEVEQPLSAPKKGCGESFRIKRFPNFRCGEKINNEIVLCKKCKLQPKSKLDSPQINSNENQDSLESEDNVQNVCELTEKEQLEKDIETEYSEEKF